MWKIASNIKCFFNYLFPGIFWRCYKLKFAAKKKVQRFKRGYSDSDVWNFYDWFLTIIPPMLMQMRDKGYGFPFGKTQEEWQNYLSSIVNDLNEAKRLSDEADEEIGREKAVELSNQACKKIKSALDKIGNEFFNLWD